MSRKRVLVAHPRVTASGGGNAVAAWTLQALFTEVSDAADKIERVLGDVALQAELRGRMAGRRELFTTEAFCDRLRVIVDCFE